MVAWAVTVLPRLSVTRQDTPASSISPRPSPGAVNLLVAEVGDEMTRADAVQLYV
jgi:hypothetical protein